MLNKYFLISGALFGLIAFAAGAFGAHALKHKLSQEMLSAFEIGVRYQMYHALVLLVIAVLTFFMPSLLLSISGWLLSIGTVVFSGSLYLLVLTGIRSCGAVTPVGGVILLLGWLLLILAPFYHLAPKNLAL